MPISVVWTDDHKTAIHYIYDDRWSMTEFNNAYVEARTMIAQVDHPVDFIIDVQNSGVLPNGVLARGNTLTALPHENEGITIIVGANPLIRSVFNLFKKVYGARVESRFRFASNLDEAYSIIGNKRVH